MKKIMITQFARANKRKSQDIISFLRKLDENKFKKARPSTRIEKVYLDFYYDEFIYLVEGYEPIPGYGSKQSVQLIRLKGDYKEYGITPAWHWREIKLLKEQHKYEYIYKRDYPEIKDFEKIKNKILTNKLQQSFNKFIEDKEEYKNIQKYEKKKVI